MMEKETDKILRSIEGIQRAEASPFMYEKIIHKLENEKPFQNKGFVVSSPFVLALFLLLCINLFTFFYLNSGKKTNDAKQNIKVLIKEYQLDLN